MGVQSKWTVDVNGRIYYVAVITVLTEKPENAANF